jgi:hypothetical protein
MIVHFGYFVDQIANFGGFRVVSELLVSNTASQNAAVTCGVTDIGLFMDSLPAAKMLPFECMAAFT